MKPTLRALAVATCAAAVLPLAQVPAAVAATTPDPVIAAAGNIACDPANPAFNNGAGTSSACQEMATSNLLVNKGYAAVLPLGDNAYEVGSAAQYAASYDPSWGRVKTLSRPVPGNHDYLTAGASGYYDYFGSAAGTAGQGYYSYDIGAWHLIALNSNCTIVAGGCAAGSPQETWLRQDLAAHPNTCVLAYWHHPAFSSGEDGNNPVTAAFWQDLYAAGADIVLNGHAHEYERFAPQTPAGVVDPTYGITEFVDGTGGNGFEPVAPTAANSVVLRDGVFGILQLTLHSTSADFSFVDALGSFSDNGTVNCHGAPPSNAPASPTGVDATIGNGQATVSWTPSGGTVDSYTVTASPGGATATVPGSAASAVVGGLANGTAYTFTVTAVNAAGTSPPSALSRAVVPLPPLIGNDYAKQVLQDAPAGYWRLGEAGTSSPAADSSGNGRTGTYSGGVTVGQPGATASNTAAAYDGSTGATTIPDASPLRLNGAFTVEFWARMSSFANSWPGILRKGAAGTADGYVVWYTSNGTLHFKRANLDIATPAGQLTTSFRHFALVDNGSTATWYVNGVAVASGPLAAPVAAGSAPLVIGQGDQPGSEVVDDVAVYNSALPAARIAAHYNAANVSPASPPPPPPPAPTAPGAPTAVSATAGNAAATVSWLAPASNGGSPITSYVVTSSAGQTATVDGNTLVATVTGLTNGSTYTFTVTAANAAGSSPPSTPSGAVTPAAPVTTPGAPTTVTATAGNAAATVTWQAPASNGGSPITSYVVTSSGGQTATVDGNTLTATVTGLTNGSSYSFTVTATNSAGNSPPSTPSGAVTPAAPVTIPGAPTTVTATAGNAAATVTWQAPASNGGSPITSYVVTSSGGQTATVDGNTLVATVTGLTNGSSYSFTVTATNSAGNSPPSTPSGAVTPAAPVTTPGAPTTVTATAGNAAATVTWQAPASTGGSAITAYTVRASSGQTSTVSGTVLSASITGLTNGTAYTFTVTATNAAGNSPASTPSSPVTPTAPTPPPPAPAYSSTVLADSPLAYWRLGESSGTTAVDASGHVNGTYAGGVTLGQAGALPSDTASRSVLFNGSSGSVNVPDSAALRLNGAFTIEFWAKLKTFTNSWPGLVYKGPSATASGYLIWYAANGTVHFKRNNVDLATPAGALSTTAWHYFAVTYDGTTLRWYVDGQSVASRAVAFPANTGTAMLQLGRGDQYGSQFMDEVAFYGTALSAARVGAHFAAA